MESALDTANTKRLEEIVTSVPELDKEILQRGMYVHDNFWYNYGVSCDSSVVLTDLGSVTSDLDRIEESLHDYFFLAGSPLGREQRLNKRGFVLYERRNAIKVCGPSIVRAYEKATGLEFDMRIKFTLEEKDLLDWREEIVKALERMEMGLLQPRDYLDIHQTLMRKINDKTCARVMGNAVWRNKYAKEFRAIAGQELKRYFNPRGTPVPSQPYIA